MAFGKFREAITRVSRAESVEATRRRVWEFGIEDSPMPEWFPKPRRVDVRVSNGVADGTVAISERADGLSVRPPLREWGDPAHFVFFPDAFTLGLGFSGFGFSAGLG